jgi:hypothetical protein
MTIRGKEYKARFISVLTLEKVMLITSKLDELQQKLLDPQAETEYKALWLQMCALIVEGDVSGLSLDVISASDKAEVVGFFTQLANSEMVQYKNGRETSPDTLKEAKAEA